MDADCSAGEKSLSGTEGWESWHVSRLKLKQMHFATKRNSRILYSSKLTRYVANEMVDETLQRNKTTKFKPYLIGVLKLILISG